MSTAQTRNRRLGERTQPAAFKIDDQKGSGGMYSSDQDNASIVLLTRYRANRTGRLQIGRAILAEKSRRPVHRFKPQLLRMREIETIVRARYGNELPENDGDEFFRAIAHALHAHESGDVLTGLRNGCGRWAPWAPETVLIEVAASVRHRTHDLRADGAAKLLCVTMEERIRLGLKTIGACDISKTERLKIMKAKKMESDRERQRVKRKSEGRKDRKQYVADSASKTRPWEAEGISRRTWYRRRGTSLSRVEDIRIGDTPVPNAATAAEKALEKSNLMQVTKRRPRREAQRSEAEGREPEPRAHRDMHHIRAAFALLHDPKTRWIAVPGSATDVMAA